MIGKELLQGLGSVKVNGSSVKLENNYLLFTGNIWPTPLETYIPIEDCTHTFEYDIVYESDVGNYFYVGVERYAEDKTTGTNSSTIYQIATNNTAKTKQRIRGTINLNQDTSSGNKTAFIRLRILNQWTGSSGTDVTAKIYHLSIREINSSYTTTQSCIIENGVLKTDVLWENFDLAGLTKSTIIESNQFYEY